MPRVVLDTNIVVSTLVFSQGKSAALRHAWQSADYQPLLSRTTATELIRVLTYPKFKLTPAEQTELLADYFPWCQSIQIPNPPPTTPECLDAFDLPFLQLAIAGKANYLVTGDTAKSMR